MKSRSYRLRRAFSKNVNNKAIVEILGKGQHIFSQNSAIFSQKVPEISHLRCL